MHRDPDIYIGSYIRSSCKQPLMPRHIFMFAGDYFECSFVRHMDALAVHVILVFSVLYLYFHSAKLLFSTQTTFTSQQIYFDA
jgi:hypothetical protein